MAGFNTGVAQTPVTITIQPVKDNTIYQRNTSNSNGAGEFLIAGTTGSPYFNHGLIKFDIAGSIPAGSTITGASLTLHLAGTSGNSGPYGIQLHKVLEDWGEGGSNAGTQAGQGAPATTNEATWTYSFFPSVLWTSPGGNYTATASAAQTVDIIGFYNWSSAGMISDIQNWLNNSSSNYGWLLKSNELVSFQAKKFESKENPVAPNRPQLTITYTLNKAPLVSITAPAQNATFNAGSAITVRAAASDSDGVIAKVEFFYIDNGIHKLGEDLNSPYELTGQDVEPGNYRVIAKATDNKGAVSVSDTLNVTVTSCAGSGSISALGYTGIAGTYLINLSSNASYPGSPAIVTELNSFEYGPNIADNYGAKVSGYICAPLTGFYTFYIASDDQSELWLSTDDNMLNIRRIAYVETRVNPKAWFTLPTQRSVPIRLIKGARYFIESVHKEGTGLDHLSVAWALPNGVFQGPIPGSRLSPFTSLTPAITMNRKGLEAMNPGKEQNDVLSGLTISVMQNPSAGKFAIITKSNSETPLNIIVTDMLGRVVEKQSGVPAIGTIYLGGRLNTGVYLVEVIQGTVKKRLKITRG